MTPHDPRKSIVWTGRIAILLAPLLLLAATELVVRLLGVEERISAALVIPQWLEPDQLAQKTWLHELEETSPQDLRAFYSSYVRDRFLFWRLRPNLRMESGRRIGRKADAKDVGITWTLDTNVRGFRGPV